MSAKINSQNKAKPSKTSQGKAPQSKTIARNRSVRFEYEILEAFEAGIVLNGCEVKSLRGGGGDLTDCYVLIRQGEAWLHGLRIKPYEQGNRYNTDPDRKRKLLLSKKQIRYLDEKVKAAGMTIPALKVYFNRRAFVKVEIALAKGKKIHDKRRTIAKRTQEREIQRDIKQHMGHS